MCQECEAADASGGGDDAVGGIAVEGGREIGTVASDLGGDGEKFDAGELDGLGYPVTEGRGEFEFAARGLEGNLPQ